MMVQMVDTASWISVLIREAEAWRSDTGECRKHDHISSNRPAVHRDNTAEQAWRMESLGDV